MNMDPIPEAKCSSCKKTATELKLKRLPWCSVCKVPYYCSTACQKANFKTHKHTCEMIKTNEDFCNEGNDIEYLFQARFGLANLMMESANDKRVFEMIIEQLKHCIALEQRDDSKLKMVQPWLSFMYLMIDDDQMAYQCVKSISNPKLCLERPEKSLDLSEDYRDQFVADRSAYSDRMSVFYTWVMIFLKFKVEMKMERDYNQWKSIVDKMKGKDNFEKKFILFYYRHYDYFSDSPVGSKNFQFFCSRRLMNCLEYFIKGNPEQFEKLRFEQRCQMTYYLELMPLDEIGLFFEFFFKIKSADYSKCSNSVELAVKYGTRFGKKFGDWCLLTTGHKFSTKITLSEKDKIRESIGRDSSDIITALEKLSEEKETIPEIQFTDLLKEQEIRCYFQSRHDWPKEEKILGFISKDKTIKRIFKNLDIPQPTKLYNHEIALSLWNARLKMNWADHRIHYRCAGWRIKV